MAHATLTIDLDAIAANWRMLDSMSSRRTATAATLKADAYGTGVTRVARRLAQEGARTFFIATVEEGAALRQALGDGPDIYVYSGHMRGDASAIGDLGLIPLLNSPKQVRRHFDALPGAAFGVQLDTGMNRLGVEASEWASVRDDVLARGPALLVSHLACSDDPDSPMNAHQLAEFHRLTEGVSVARSLAATGGTLLGHDYHFDLTRPGIGLYSGAPFDDGVPAVTLDVPVIQVRDVEHGETVGYGQAWTASRRSRIATISAGYADGVLRAAAAGGFLAFADGVACPVVGRVSMDLITVDVTDLSEPPTGLQLVCDAQTVDDLAACAGTIGYEILTSLGARYHRKYHEA